MTRLTRALALGITLSAAFALTLSSAEARHRRHHPKAHHRVHHAKHRPPKARYVALARAPLDIRPAPQIAATDMLAEAQRYVGSGNVTGYSGIPWCGAFMQLIARRTGHAVPQGALMARRWAYAGRRLRGPAVGAIAVMPHHVTIVAGVTRGGIIGLGGNQGHRVRYSYYSSRRIIAYVEPI